jgi:hypothetical protein
VDVVGREEYELISFDEVRFLFCCDSYTVRTVMSLFLNHGPEEIVLS